MRILELFAGYGSQALALENLGIDFTSDISEIDKYAIQAYNQLHGDTHNWGDITQIDETKLPYYDLITYSSPCQDFSVAGLQKGGDKDSGTRSSLLWECERIIRAVKPKHLLMENVKNLVGKKHKHNFIRWLQVLEMMGYQNYWQVLNAKDYGVPQNRERVFVVSILGCGQYIFPNPIPLTRKLKDVLEPVVDEKYYLSQDKVEKLVMNMGKEVSNTIRCGGGGSTDGKHTWDIVAQPVNTDSDNCARTICSNYYKQTPDNVIGVGYGCSNTITTVEKDNYLLEPAGLYIHDSEAFHKKPLEGLSRCLKAEKHDAAVVQLGNIVNTGNWDNPQAGRVYSTDGVSPTLNTMQDGQREPKILKNYRIRKLTPLECWRLMGVKDEQFNKLHDISNSQLYKLAGNSIVVDVLMGIFKNLLVSDEGTKGQLTLL